MISFVVAASKNNVIGINNKLPWNIPQDLKRFKKITSGNSIIMGRKTFESIGRPLPNRENIVLTRNTNWKSDGITIFNQIETLKDYLKKNNAAENFVIGGSEIFKIFEPEVEKIYFTLIDKNYNGDAFFNSELLNNFVVASREKIQDEIPFEFIDYVKK